MSNLKINANIDEILSLIDKEEKFIKEAMDVSIGFGNAVKESTWAGEARDSFILFNELTIMYHDNIVYLIESLKKHTMELIKDVDEFSSTSINMRNLKG